MSNNDDNFGLSRRQMLGGLGIVGVASAGAGLGTTAYFSDQQEFTDNTLTAGTLALSVEQKIVSINQDGIGPDELEYFGDTNEGGEAIVVDEIEIIDAKPGDEYEFCWHVEIEGNPGFAKVMASGVVDENGVEAGNVSVDDLYDIDEESDLTTIGAAANATATLTLADGSTVVIYENSLGGLLAALADGIPVPSAVVDDGPDEFCHDTEAGVELCVEITIPTDVGNELQGASSSFNMEFYAEQCRHNDIGTFLGKEAETALGQDFVSVEEDFAQTSMSARGRYGDGGDPQTWEVGIWESTMTDEDANYPWVSGEQVPFVFEYDGGADVSTFDLDGVEVSALGGEPQGRIGIQTKADQATVAVENLTLVDASGIPTSLVGPDGVTASNDGAGRDLQYLVMNTSASALANGFVLSGDVTVTLEGDYDGDEEGVAFDVVVE